MATDWNLLASLVEGSATEHAACDRLVRELARTFCTRACLFARVSGGWRVVVRTHAEEPPAGLAATLSAAATPGRAGVDLHRVGDALWTSMTLNVGEPALAILLSGDWTAPDLMLQTQAMLLSFALRSVRERDRCRAAERLLADGYTMTRRLSRLGSIDAICRRVVEQASRSLNAERVTLALYRPDEDRLAVAATHGYAASIVQDVRIVPGSWILGHVYSSGRSVLVSDVRRIHGTAVASRPYKTFSFAAVPVRAGADVVGVLSATDKIDGSAFDRRDAGRLRSLGAPAGLALMAARSDTEVRRLAHAARVDPVTGLFNRRYFEARLSEELERARRGGTPLTMLMADIDDFKAVNDRHGHQTGDAVLHLVGGILRSAVRLFDVCARYGGDEFVILMPGIGRSSAAACGERIRQYVAESRMPGLIAAGGPRASGPTVSIGLAVSRVGDSPADLVRRADRVLYQSKAAGKNRVLVDADVPAAPASGPRDRESVPGPP